MTAKEFFALAIKDMEIPEDSLIYQDKFEIVNRAVESIAGIFAGLLSKYYLTEDTVSVTANNVDLSSLRIMRAGKEVSFTVATDSVRAGLLKPLSPEAFRAWNTGNLHNKNDGVFVYQGDNLKLKFGSEISSPANIDLWYTKLPDQVSQDSDDVDLPEGAPMELGILKATVIISKRLGLQRQPSMREVRESVQQLYDQVNILAGSRDIEKDIRALI